MKDITFRVLDQFPEPAYSALVDEAFSDYGESELLSAVAQEEAAARTGTPAAVVEGALRIGAFRGEELIGWTYAHPEGALSRSLLNGEAQ